MISLLVLAPFSALIFLNLIPRPLVNRLGPRLTGALFFLQIYLATAYPAWFWKKSFYTLEKFLNFGLFTDNLSRLALLTIGIVLFSCLVTAARTIKEKTQQLDFINLILVAVIGMNATVMVADVFSLYVFIEVTAISSFILIALQKDKPGLEGAFKYLIISAVASVAMLSAIALLVLVAGGTSFSVVSSGLKANPASLLAKLAVSLFLCGLFVKSGSVPFHGWLPDAYSAAPPAVSVFLAGIATKVSGVYVLMRCAISVFGLNPDMQSALMFIGAFSIIFGALAAFTQSDFKRMLAYSSISQIGYIILALGCATPLALAGAAFHFFNHAVFKSLLFTNAACLQEQLGTLDMERMGGLAQKMPFTGTTSIIGFLSAAGIPPLSGFWSKLIIVLALFSSGNFVYGCLALLASVLTLGYFLVMNRKVFFGKVTPALNDVREAGGSLVFVEIALAAVTVGAGLLFPLMLESFILPIKNIF